MKLEKGLVFTGKWFIGRVEVIEVKVDSNELEVKLQSKLNATDDDYWWFETWNLEHTIKGFESGDYFLNGFV